MKSIAIISNQAFSSINFRGSLISALVKKQVRVYAFAPDFNDVLRKQLVDLGATPVDIGFNNTGMNPLQDLFNMFKLLRCLRRLRPDVTLGYSVKPVIYGTLASWLACVPHRVAMIEGLGYVFTSTSINVSLKRRLLRNTVIWLYRVALARAHRVIFLNTDDIADFVLAGLVNKGRVDLLGGIGVDLNDWAQAPAVKSPVTFLLAARLLYEKGILQYVEAARQVKPVHPQTRFILLGGLDENSRGPSMSQVMEWVDEGLLEWPGHVAVKPWLAQSSVFVLPSFYREGLPRSTQEAMALGRAVITTDSPGCRETVVSGINGYLVPVRDVPAIVSAMLEFVKKPSLIESMGHESRKIAEERFDIHKINARILKILSFD